MNKKTIVFGCGLTGKKVYELAKEKYDIIYFSDSNEIKWNNKVKMFDGKEFLIIPPQNICNVDYDVILVGSTFIDETFVDELERRHGIKRKSVSFEYIWSGTINVEIEARKNFVKYNAEKLNKMDGSVAEGGVYLGDFAAVINESFPKKRLHLFDTFEGFDQRDISVEQEYGFSSPDYDRGYFRKPGFSMSDLMNKMPHYQNVFIHKGYFPESVCDDDTLADERFVFVNLDFDLYMPTLAGLEFFYNKLNREGIILVHDYFSRAFRGAKQAVDVFCERNRIPFCAIGDGVSVAIIRAS